MAKWYEIDPGQLAINPDETYYVTVKNNSVEWYSESGEKVDFNYGSPLAAETAYNDYIAFVNTPIIAPGIESGNVVRLRGDGNKRVSENIDYLVIQPPTELYPFWVLLGNQTATLYALNLTGDTILEKV